MKKNLLKFFGAAIFTALVLSPNKSNAQAGAGLNFDGISDVVNMGNALTASLNPLNVITVEAWVMPTSTVSPSGYGLIVGNYNSPLNQTQFFLRRQGMNYAFYVNVGGGLQGVVALNTVTLSSWQHLAGVWNGTTITLYLNGASVGTATTAAGPFSVAATTNSVIMGYENAGGGEGFTGSIDEVRIWGVARTQCQINTYKNCEIPTTAPNLLANYHFNQGVAAAANPTVTTLTDVSGNSFTGTLTTFALTGATSNWITPGGVVSGFTTALASPTLGVVSSQTAAACPGSTVNLTASGATAYAWVAPLTSTTAVANITVQVISPTYSVTGTAITGCAGTGTFVQAVTPNPVSVAASPASTIICTGESVTLTASGGTAYTWQAPLTSTVAAAVISPTAAGNFTYTVLSTSSVCANYTWTTAFTQSVSGCVGIQNAVSQALSFGVYPNPTAGEFTIELSNGTTKTVEVIDFTGRVVLSNTSAADKINMNLSTLAKGIYYVRVLSNNTIEVAKLIKE